MTNKKDNSNSSSNNNGNCDNNGKLQKQRLATDRVEWL
jgi:hypothetical protein